MNVLVITLYFIFLMQILLSIRLALVWATKDYFNSYSSFWIELIQLQSVIHFLIMDYFVLHEVWVILQIIIMPLYKINVPLHILFGKWHWNTISQYTNSSGLNMINSVMQHQKLAMSVFVICNVEWWKVLFC